MYEFRAVEKEIFEMTDKTITISQKMLLIRLSLVGGITGLVFRGIEGLLIGIVIAGVSWVAWSDLK